MKALSVTELRQWQQAGKDFLLVDVREPFEHEHFHIGGQLIPLGELMQRSDEIPRAQPVVFYCEKGIRSLIALQRLEALGFENLYNLSGGMKAWRQSEK